MVSKSISFDLDASPEAVWHVVGERWGEIHRYVPRISASRLTSDGEVGRGSTRACTLERPALGLESFEEVLTEWRPREAFTYELVDPPFPLKRLANRWTLAPIPAGTRLTLEPQLELRGGPLTGWLEGFALRRLLADLSDDQEDLRSSLQRAVREVEESTPG